MAVVAVSFLLENVTQLIIQEGDRLGRVWLEIRGIDEELEFMASSLERSEAQNQFFDEDTVAQIKSFIVKAETLVEEYATIASEMETAGIYKRIIYHVKQHSSRSEVKRFGVEVKRFTSTLSGRTREVHLRLRLPDGGQSEVPRYLWRLIYYFLLFAADFEIPARRLIALWVAEGLIRTGNRDGDGDTSVEDVAERDLDSLINLGVVRVTKKKPNGKVQACLLRDGILGEWLSKANSANFFQSRTEKVHRLVDRTDADADAGASFVRIHGNPSISNSVPNYGDVISFLSFDTREGSKPGEDIGNFLDKCIAAERFLWLRVLDLERVFRPNLPDTLGKLIRLKYLGLRWTYLQSLPDFINKLLQLRVLDVKHTYITALPKSIWHMQDMRHLYLSEAYRTRFPHRPPGKRVSLAHLQTLWGAFVDEGTSVRDGLDSLRDLRKLGLSCRPRSTSSRMLKNLKAVDEWISKLGKLQNLRLKSRDEEGEAADLHLTTLERNVNLSTVYLLGKLSPDVVKKFPLSLTDITLSGSGLDMDPMGFLGKLPKLQILRFLAKSVVHPRLHCYGGSFPQLKVVYIWCLENLEEWQVEEGSLPCLENFEIRSCPNLKNLPAQLEHLDTLEKFQLTSMPDGFMHETRSNYLSFGLRGITATSKTDEGGMEDGSSSLDACLGSIFHYFIIRVRFPGIIIFWIVMCFVLFPFSFFWLLLSIVCVR